jgi:ParB family chromosome partitioning protein
MPPVERGGANRKEGAMSRKDVINSLFTAKLGAPNRPETQPRRAGNEPVRSGAVSAVSSVLSVMAGDAREAGELREQIKAGAVVIEIDPGLVDGSSIADRIPTANDPEYDALLESMRESGQKVPILVRPHPTIPGRYQIAYGRRRVRGAGDLGTKVKAQVLDLTDEELVVAQGLENGPRKDRSWIENALYARRLEDADFDRSIIQAALATDKADLSRYISIARRIPESLIEAIGPAPKAGRARWTALADRLEKPAVQVAMKQVVDRPEFQAADSDARFAIVVEALRVAPPRRRGSVGVWHNPNGKKAARIERANGRTTISFEEKHVPEFAAYLEGRLDELYHQFVNQKEEGSANEQN